MSVIEITKRKDNHCDLDVPYDPCGCEQEYYCCEPKCPPKVDARWMIRVDRRFRDAQFLLKANSCAGSATVPAIVDCIEVIIRRQGYCKELGKFRPYKYEASTGAFTVRWERHMRSLPPGQYEIDVYVNGCYYNTIGIIFVDVAIPIHLTQDNEECRVPNVCVDTDVEIERNCGC